MTSFFLSPVTPLPQQYYKPFGVVSIFDSDDALLALHEKEATKLAEKIRGIRSRTSRKVVSPNDKSPEAVKVEGGADGRDSED